MALQEICRDLSVVSDEVRDRSPFILAVRLFALIPKRTSRDCVLAHVRFHNWSVDNVDGHTTNCVEAFNDQIQMSK